MPHIVYRLVFEKRKSENTLPYQYIGSKTNCQVVDGKIVQRNGSFYYGSSKSKEFAKALAEETPSVEVLYCSDTNSMLIEVERQFQLDNKVVSCETYFNLAYASKSNFTDPEYASYRSTITGKTVRLKRDDEAVLSGRYVGVSKGVKTGRVVDLNGDKNPFFGKKHTEETKSKIGKANKERVRTEQERKNISNSLKGREILWKEKMGRKGLQMYKNSETGEVVRISKEEFESTYDNQIWKPLAHFNKPSKKICEHCNKEVNTQHYNAWHGDKCQLVNKRWKPWRILTNKNNETFVLVYSKAQDIEALLLNTEIQNTKGFFKNVVLPMIKKEFFLNYDKGNIDVIIQKLYNAIVDGRFSHNKQSYLEWLNESQKH